MIHFNNWKFLVGYRANCVDHQGQQIPGIIKGVKYSIPKDNVSISMDEDPTFYPVRLYTPKMRRITDLSLDELFEIFSLELNETVTHPGLGIFTKDKPEEPIATIDESYIKLIRVQHPTVAWPGRLVLVTERTAIIDGQTFPLGTDEVEITINTDRPLDFLSSQAWLKCLEYRVDMWGYLHSQLALPEDK